MKTLVKIQKNLGISSYCGFIHLSVARKFENGKYSQRFTPHPRPL